MWEAEVFFGALIVIWILYELYGRNAIQWIQDYMVYIRIAGGCAVIGFLWWQSKKQPDEFTDTLNFIKQLFLPSQTGKWTASNQKTERNVTNLMKKKIAADQSWTCGHCKQTLDESYEVDHVLALFNGGTNDMSNLIALCRNCHGKKTMKERIG